MTGLTDSPSIVRLNLLVEMLTDFASVPDVDSLLVSVGARARFLVSFSRCVIVLGDSLSDPSRVAIAGERGFPSSATIAELLPLEAILAARALDTTLPAVDDLRRPRVACYPLASASRQFGVVIFTGADEAAYTMADLRIVQVLADACAGVLARLEMGAVLQAMADERGMALVNEQRAHAAADAANRAKDEFLATLSHEMRTPLNAILGWVQTLQRAVTADARMTRGLAAIERSAHDQRRLVEELLEMSRIVLGQVRLEVDAVDLRTIIADALVGIGPAVEAKRLTIETELDEEAVIRGDAARLQQVLWNLLSNAVRFTPPSGTIRVAATRAGDSIAIQVTDTGLGIEPELLPYVFDRFRQGDGSPNRAHGGLGLGLSIVRSITELHGGTVVAESRGTNRGTTMTVTLPAAPEPSACRPLRPAQSPPLSM